MSKFCSMWKKPRLYDPPSHDVKPSKTKLGRLTKVIFIFLPYYLKYR